MVMRLAKRKSFSRLAPIGHELILGYSIIQDCEDALTNWVTANAAVAPKLSTRARTLSQRRKSRNQGEGVDLSGQDSSMKDRESGLWVPAGAHREYADDGEEEEEEEEEATEAHPQDRGREGERAVEA